MKFSEMPHERPDLRALSAALRESAAKLKRADGFGAAEAVMLSADEAVRRFDTAYAAAFIRFNADTEDEACRADFRSFAAAAPKAELAEKKWLAALGKSEFSAGFKAKYGKDFFDAAPELPPAAQRREAALVGRYEDILGAARVTLCGGEVTLTEAAALMKAPDPERRYAAWEAVAGYFGSHAGELDGIFERLVRIRARSAGEGGYAAMRCRALGRDMSGDDLFRKAVLSSAVPLADGIFRAFAKRTGLRYPLSPMDAKLACAFPRPACTARELPGVAARILREMSPQTAELADALFGGGYADTEHRPGKSGDTFCIALPDSGMPFVLADLTGTGDDVQTLFHELGHAFAVYSARGIVPARLRIPSPAACETFAVCMEFFMRPYAERIFGGDAEKFRHAHLAQTVCAIPAEAMADRFQREVYADPSMTPRERCGLWLALSEQYAPWLDLSAAPPFFASGRGWQTVAHIYGEPFYYLEYALARGTALQLSDGEHGGPEAWEAYLRAAGAGGTQSYTQLLGTAGLGSPYDAESFRAALSAAERALREAGRLE